MEETSKHGVLGRHQSCSEERIEVLSNTIEHYHSSRNTPSLLYPKVVRMDTGEVIYEKVYMSPRPPPKISLKHEWKRELGPEVAQRPEVGQLSRSFQSNQPTLNPIRERTVRPVVKDETRTVQDGRKTSRCQEIDVNSFCEETVSSERTERPVVETSVIQARLSEDRQDFNVEQTHERTGRPVINEKVYASPRLPPKISLRDNSMKEPNSEVAGHDEGSQQTKPKNPNPIVRTGRPFSTEPPSSTLLMCLLNVQTKTKTQTKT